MNRIMLSLAVLLLAGSALAQPVDPDPDMVGIYYDLDATIYCASPPLYTPTNLYVCFTNITETSGISGWEANIEIVPAPAIPPTFTLLGTGALNVSTAPDFVVGLASPTPWQPSIGVLSITVTPLAEVPTLFYLNGANVSSFGGLPGYAAGDDPGQLNSCGWSGLGNLCAVMFGDCIVIGTEDQTWGGVKSLYR